MGELSLEIWRSDGVTPFVREPQGVIERGTLANYSFTLCGNELFWLDQHAQIVKMGVESRTPVVLSEPLTSYFFPKVLSVLEGDYLIVQGKHFYILNSHFHELTIAYDIDRNTWYEWSWWNSTTSTYKAWEGRSIANSGTWGNAYTGHRDNGKVYKLDPRIYFDGTDTIRTMLRTPILDHGTSSIRKTSHKMIFEIRQDDISTTQGDDIPTLSVRFRDNGSTTWQTARTVTLGAVGNETFYRGSLWRNGSFYNRQYEIVNASDLALTIVRVIDVVEFCLS